MDQKKNSGYSLIEILVALAILMIITVPLLHGFLTGTSLNTKAKKVLQATTAGKNVMEEVKSKSVESLVLEYSGTVDAEGITYIQLENQNVDSRNFRVEVTIDPTSYKSETPSTTPNLNDVALSTIFDMDSAYDAFFGQPATQDQEMATQFGTGESIFLTMERTYTLDVTTNGSGVYVDLNCFYTYNGLTKYAVTDQRIYAGSASTNQAHLRNVYLLYSPMYGNVSREEILIRNPNLYPVNIYLVKQHTSETTVAKELQYQSKIKVEEGSRSDFMDENGKLSPVTSLRTNMTNEQMVLTYNGLSTLTIAEGIYSASEILGLKDLTESVVSDRIYQIKVKVYEQDDETNKELVTMEGTKEE